MPAPDWLDINEYPFTSHFLDVGPGRLHYLDEGWGDPVLMLHGNPTWSFLYRHLIRALHNDNRCVVPDHLGFGLSEKPPEWGYSPENHARNIARLINELELDDLTLVLQDWGGPIGLSYAVENSDRVQRIILLNTWAWPLNRSPYYASYSWFMGSAIGRFLTQRFNLFPRTFLRSVFGDSAKLTDTMLHHYLKPLENPAARAASLAFARHVLASTDWLRSIWERRDQLAEKPMLIIWGMKDIAFRKKELRRWEKTYPEAQVVRLQSSGHFVQEEAPKTVSGAVRDFLGATGSDSSP